jgi:hypothetical protein
MGLVASLSNSQYLFGRLFLVAIRRQMPYNIATPGTADLYNITLGMKRHPLLGYRDNRNAQKHLACSSQVLLCVRAVRTALTH